MQQFMWQQNLLQVANFSDAGMTRLPTVDPIEGSTAGWNDVIFLSCLDTRRLHLKCCWRLHRLSTWAYMGPAILCSIQETGAK